MASKLEKIALEKLRAKLFELLDRIVENEKTPEREVQNVLPFMKSPVKECIGIVDAITENN